MTERHLVAMPLSSQDPIAVRAELLAAQRDFWDGRDTTHLHHPVWFRQFAGHGLVIRDLTVPVAPVSGAVPGLLNPPRSAAVAYLLGAVTADGIGYVHVVAARRSHRGRGLARRMWATFETRAREAGAKELHAITTPGNTGSIAFHTAIGMTAVRLPDYSGPGEDRMLFRRTL
ncbi:GNAT family N-acetyltransferase [Rhizomonospora bruguierae]|uniref:GNAT family N-acetyltransferase n=1 Tax=Rhizomonospora bruguierae TaxID=1581705 RepID=UPI001BD142FE|nr:GNAT family N-acetyltransferase [Micromonospora sp. NBRC 107566]